MNDYEARVEAFKAVLESHPREVAWREFAQSQRAAELQRAAQRNGLRHLDAWLKTIDADRERLIDEARD